jgi:cob(I)alamin adenosyltransferase
VLTDHPVETQKFQVRIEPGVKKLYATASMVLTHLMELDKQEYIALKDVAWIKHQLASLDRFREEAHESCKHDEKLLGFGQISTLIEEAHMISEEILTGKPVTMHAQTPEGEFDVVLNSQLFPEGLDERFEPLVNRIGGIIDALDQLQNRPYVTHQELGHIQSKLHEAENKFKAIQFTSEGDIPEGQAAISDVLDEIYDRIHDLVIELPCDLYDEPEVDAALEPLEHKLKQIIEQLHNLKEKPANWITTKDVGKIQVRLHDIDEQYRMNKFEKAGKIPNGQAIVSDLLERAHEITHELSEVASEPEDVADELQPVNRRLKKIFHALNELKQNPRELTTQQIGRLQNELSKVDAKYEEGKVKVGGKIPQGQAQIAEMLDSAHEIAHELYLSIESQ